MKWRKYELYELITLGIAETYPNTDQFTVLAITTDKNNIVSLDLNKDDIITETGKVFWDIAFSTYVDDLEKHTGTYDNVSYIPHGVRSGENRQLILKKTLDSLSENIDVFAENTKCRYAVAKATSISDIILKIDRDGINRHRIATTIKKWPVHLVQDSILIKDYRWINYWNWAFENGVFEEKKKKYIDLYNRKDKTLYYILYRRFYSNKNRYWVSGMHWL